MKFKAGQKIWNAETGKQGKVIAVVTMVRVETAGYGRYGTWNQPGRVRRNWAIKNCSVNRPRRKSRNERLIETVRRVRPLVLKALARKKPLKARPH